MPPSLNSNARSILREIAVAIAGRPLLEELAAGLQRGLKHATALHICYTIDGETDEIPMTESDIDLVSDQ